MLLLSLKSGFCNMPGLERMMRLTSKASDKSIALRSRLDASIILFLRLPLKPWRQDVQLPEPACISYAV